MFSDNWFEINLNMVGFHLADISLNYACFVFFYVSVHPRKNMYLIAKPTDLLTEVEPAK